MDFEEESGLRLLRHPRDDRRVAGMNATEALLSIARQRPLETSDHESTDDNAGVVAIVRLASSRRSWFVTEVRRTGCSIEVVGYAPGCMHSAGDWFSLQADFFEIAATASGDQLEVEVLETPVPLEMLEDESL